MNDFWGWLDDNSQLLSAVASLAMTIIWVVYLQIALTSFRRQRRPRLVVSQGERSGMKSTFMLINLSQEPVHIGCILVAINAGEEEEVYEITDFDHSGVDSPPDGYSAGSREETLRYGPVQAGSFLVIGPASPIFNYSVNHRNHINDEHKSLEDRFEEYVGEIAEFEIRVVGTFSTDDRVVGARRRYRVIEEVGEVPKFRPMSNETEQLVSRREQSTLQEWSELCRDT